jgi:hypothetical protein
MTFVSLLAKALKINFSSILDLSIYVDNFNYFSASNMHSANIYTSNTWAKLPGSLAATKLGTWQHTEDGKMTCSITPTATITLLEELHMLDNCNSILTPDWVGLIIDHIPHDSIPPDNKMLLVKSYQHLVSGPNWLDVMTHPNGQPLYNDNKVAIEWTQG